MALHRCVCVCVHTGVLYLIRVSIICGYFKTWRTWKTVTMKYDIGEGYEEQNFFSRELKE